MIEKLMGIPLKLEIYYMLVIVYPAAQARPKLMRDKTKMVHHDYCGLHNFRTDEEVRDYIRMSPKSPPAPDNKILK